MPRLVICSPTFWPEPVGTPRYATDAARWFKERGWDVVVVTSQPFYPDFRRYPGWGRAKKRDQLDGIPIHRLATIVPREGRALGRMIGDLNFSAQVLLSGRLRRLHPPDAVLTFSPGVPLGVAAARGFRSKGQHVVVVHDLLSGLAAATGMASGSTLPGIRAMERLALRSADHRIVLSEAMSASLRELRVEGASSVVPIWTDIGIADAAVAADHERFTVGYSGNLGRKQGIGLLLDVCDDLAGDDVLVRIRGRGALRELAESRTEALPQVELLDFVPSEALAASLAEVDLHLAPQGQGTGSYSMPSKVINVFASGRPLLAICDRGGPLYQLAEKGLALWAPPDAAAVAQKIRDVRSDPSAARDCADRALAYVDQNHDRHRLLSHIEALLLQRPERVGI